MGKPCSMDLRKRVVGTVEQEGMSRRQAAARFGIAPSVAIKWLERYRRTGDVSPEADLDAVLEILFGPLYYRLLFAWGPVNEAYIDKLLNTALRGFENKRSKSAQPARKDDNK